MLAKADEWKNYATGMIFETSIVYFTALNDLARYAKLPSDEQAQLRPEIERRVADIRRLAEAAQPTLRRDTWCCGQSTRGCSASRRRPRSSSTKLIDCAQKYEMLRDEALANELAPSSTSGLAPQSVHASTSEEAFSASALGRDRQGQLREQYATARQLPWQSGAGRRRHRDRTDQHAGWGGDFDLRSVTKGGPCRARSSSIALLAA